ncbi:MAG: hypothetical protein JWP63_4574 [Candidatus Solibacter sp.]|nr:hypothetical protein [Candidatus Solibacter sp.]
MSTMRTLRYLALLLCTCAALPAADRDFDRVVKAIEQHYGTPRTHVPLMGAAMGVANFFVKVARPAGTTSFHLAVFDHFDGFAPDREEFMDRLDTGRLRPLIRAHSRQGEATYILAGEAGKSTRLLIASFSRDAAMVIQVRVNPAALRRTIDHPQGMINAYLGKHDTH